MFTKEMQLKKEKKSKISTFGRKKSKISKNSKKKSIEKNTLSNDYYEYLHSSNQSCVVCGYNCIEIHHLTDIKRIGGPRRLWNRVVTLCPNHHKNSKYGIHILSKDEFYEKVMSFKELMNHSDRLYHEYLEK